MAKNINLFTSNLSGKQLRTEKSESKKAVSAALRDYERAIDGAFTAVIKDTDRRARNVANAAKGQFKTALAVVVACYPWQTEAGTLAVAKTIEEADGSKRRVWAAKKLTAAAARGIVRVSLNNFIATVGQPVVQTVVIGEPVNNDK